MDEDDPMRQLERLEELFNRIPFGAPECDMETLLGGVTDMARNEFRDMPEEYRAALQKFAKHLFAGRYDLVMSRAQAAEAGKRLSTPLFVSTDAWLRHAIEIEIAELGLLRTEGALKRFFKLRSVHTNKPLPEQAKPYLREVVDTFLLGLDASCIALCRAAFEQLLRRSLVQRSVYTDKQLKKERPTAGTLLAKARQHKLLPDSIRAAESLVKKGDTVMHQYIFEDRIREQQALDSISSLVRVVVDLLGEPGGDQPAST